MSERRKGKNTNEGRLGDGQVTEGKCESEKKKEENKRMIERNRHIKMEGKKRDREIKRSKERIEVKE